MRASYSIFGPYRQYHLAVELTCLIRICSYHFPTGGKCWKMKSYDHAIMRKAFEGGQKINPLYKYDMELFSVSAFNTSQLLYHFH